MYGYGNSIRNTMQGVFMNNRLRARVRAMRDKQWKDKYGPKPEPIPVDNPDKPKPKP